MYLADKITAEANKQNKIWSASLFSYSPVLCFSRVLELSEMLNEVAEDLQFFIKSSRKRHFTL